MKKDILPLDQMLAEQARQIPRKTFVKFEGKKYSYREMDRLASVFAAFLAERGLKRGDRIALLSCNCFEYIAAYFGIIRAGGVVLPVNNLLTHEEVDFILQDAGVTTVFHDAECSTTVHKLMQREQGTRQYHALSETARRHAAPGPQPAFPVSVIDDVSTILYTSGTTGRPKGALLTHRNIAANAMSANEIIHISQKDRFVVFLPLFHSFTYTVCVVLPLLRGAMLSLLPGVRPFQRVVKSLILDRITLFVAIPTVYKILAEKDMPFLIKLLLNLRLCVSGAAPLPVKVIREFEAAFKVPLLEGYGLTEASPVVSINPLEKGMSKPGTVGKPLPGIDVKIVDDAGAPLPIDTPGELIVRGPNVMKGYLNRPEDTAKTVKDGWLYTGDIASLDSDGYIRIIDRKKDLIIVDGLNVYPYEVEEVLYRHPAVKDCSMIGVPHEHEEGKELGIMYVVLQESKTATAKELREYLTEHVAHYKIPRRFLFTEELPRTATGKIMKKELRVLYREQETKKH
jgi:long-chain acyl-CoA synthetase